MAYGVVIPKGLSTAVQIHVHNGRKSLLRTDGKTSLPGQPRIQLQGTNLGDYIRKTHLVTELDKLAPYLRFVSVIYRDGGLKDILNSEQIATPSSTHIYPLHEQLARGRTVSVTEHPGLHLVWYHDRIFIKPIPPYLLCAGFWEYIQEADLETWKAAAGFMRTYCYLIQYETDFRIAVNSEMHLISRDDGHSPISYEEFVEFITQFQGLDDQSVSPRYSYGALRLTRLNHLSRIFLRKFTYFHPHPQWADYLGTLIAPMVTLFAVLSTILNCMQVVLTVQGLKNDQSWAAFIAVSQWFPVVVIFLVAMLLVGVAVFAVVMFRKDQYFAWSLKRGLKGNRELAREMKSAVI